MTTHPMGAWPVPFNSPRPGDAQIRGWELLRAKLAARLTRLFHWEFWPSWAIYLPLIPYIAWLAFRHRREGGLRTCTRANPGIPLGGITGESKWDILRQLPRDAVVPTTLIEPGPLTERMALLESIIRERDWAWPIVLKPDVGERGRGVRVVPCLGDARTYLRHETRAVLIQAYHPGPFEAGVFYVRFPTEPCGRIFSITDKRFPDVIGDGRSSLRTLIWRHPRYRAQAGVFLGHLGDQADRIPAAGQRARLGDMGNHCRGSKFLDGAHLITPQLTAAIDAIASRIPGFFFGRFDIRYPDVELFRGGRGFQIVELNGLLSESSNIYDPSFGFWRAQRTLRAQWRLAFAIGSANHPSLRRLSRARDGSRGLSADHRPSQTL